MTEQKYAPIGIPATQSEEKSPNSGRTAGKTVRVVGEKPPPPPAPKRRRTLTSVLRAVLPQLLAEFNEQPKRKGLMTQLATKYDVHPNLASKYLTKHAPRLFASLPGEEWRPVVGYEGLYGVSDLGRVRRQHLLNPGLTKSGYEIVVLSKSAKRRTLTVHRLVAIAFIPNPNNLPEVNHKDGDKRNNRKGNLEWCTPQENMRHAFDNGLVVRKKTTSPLSK